MKKTLLFAASSLFALTQVSAQITLDQSDFGVIGDSLRMAQDNTLKGISVGNAGANQVWNFKGLQVDNFYDQIFLNPANTPAAADFPTADIAMVSNGLYTYMNSSATEIEVQGLNGNVAQLAQFPGTSSLVLSVNFIDNQKVMKFPSTYMDSFQDTSHFEVEIDAKPFNINGLDSVRIIRTAYTTKTMDGHGDLHLLTDTFNCLRMKTTEKTIDSIYVKLLGGWILAPAGGIIAANPLIGNTTAYSWYAKNEDFTLLEVKMDTLGTTPIQATFVLKPGLAAGLTTTTSTLCKGSCEGTATVEAIGGISPYTYTWANTMTTDSISGLCAGDYNVMVTDAAGDTVWANVTVNEPSAISVTANVFDADCDTCKKGTINTTVSGGTSPYTYSWDNSKTTASLSSLLPGDYNLTVTDKNGCTSSKKITVSSWAVGINEASISDFSIYPNPAENVVFIKSQNNTAKKLEIYNLLGANVFSNTVIGTLNKVDLSSIEKGVYLIKVTDGNTVNTKRLVVK